MKIITDPPAARIVVDGDDRGRTPVKLTLDPGTHEVTLESGKASGTFTIDVGAGQDKYCFGLDGKKLAETACN